MHAAVIALTLASILYPQFRPASATGEVLRLQVVRPGHSTCVLVHADAGYRLEERDLGRVKVRQGELTAEELADLRTLLDNPPLSDIDTRSIPVPVIREAVRDSVLLGIARDGGWKNLHFADEKSREPVKVHIDWLLGMLRKLRDRRSASLPESAANGCLPSSAAPDKKPGVEQAAATTTTGSAPQTPSLSDPVGDATLPKFDTPPFLALIRNLRLHQSARRQCLLVRRDGAFRFEKTSQDLGREMKGEVVLGRLSAEELGELERLTQGTEVQNAAAKGAEQNLLFREGETMSVAFFQESEPRWLLAGSYFGISGSRNQIVGERKLLQPFMDWLRRIEKKNLPPVADATLDDCRIQ